MLTGVTSAAVTLEGMLRVEARGWSRAAFGAWEERRPWEAIRRPGPDGLPEPVPDGRAAWRLQPWAGAIEYRLDHDGFRAGGIPEPASATCHVLALGDSHTFGYGVTVDEAWPSITAALLPRVAVVNAGLCGGSLAAEQAWLPRAMAAVHPHVVVFAVTPWSLRDDPEAPEQHSLDGRWPRLERYWLRLAARSALVDRASRLVLGYLAAVVGWPPPAPVLWELGPLVESPPAFHARWRGIHARLADMVRIARRGGAEPILLFIPLDLQVSTARNVLYRDGRLPYVTHGFVDRDYTRDDRYPRALAKSAGRLHVGLIDATATLRVTATESFLPDDYHLAPVGHARIATLMVAPLADACAELPREVRSPAMLDGPGSVRPAAVVAPPAPPVGPSARRVAGARAGAGAPSPHRGARPATRGA